MAIKEGERQNFSMCFMGANNTGKSTKAKEIAKIWRKANPNDLIISFDPQRNFSEVTDYYIGIEDPDWALKLKSVRNYLLILDDYRLINESNTPVKGLKNLLFNRTFWNIDIIHIVHAPSEMLNVFSHYTTHYYIYYTESQEDEFKRKVPNYALIKAASMKVNKYVSLFGMGTYPNFPHILVDCKTRKLNAFNMNKDMSDIPLTRGERAIESRIKSPNYKGTGHISYKIENTKNTRNNGEKNRF